MKLSTRLTRVGAAFLIFGTCAVMLPGNTGSFMTASDACTTGTSHHSTTDKVIKGFAYGGAAILLFFALNPSLYGSLPFTHTTSSNDGSSPDTSSQVGYNTATSEFQFDYGTSS